MKRYLTILFATTGIAALLYFTAELCLAPALVRAEYWVRQLLVVKREIARNFRGQRKIVVAAGSSAMFGIDTRQLGEELHVPAINLGLHAGLPLPVILEAADAASEPGDTLVLALEPPFYHVSAHLSGWQARNLMAWEPEEWRALSLYDKCLALAALGPGFLIELVQAHKMASDRRWLRKRLATLDDAATLKNFRAHVARTSFSYAPENLDPLGNMRLNDKADFHKKPASAENEIAVSPESWRLLGGFIGKMRARGVAVYLTNSPWVDTGKLDRAKVARASHLLTDRLAPLAPWLDERADLLFPPSQFFDTEFHLNAEGRKVRTHRLAEALVLRKAVPVAFGEKLP